MSGKRFDRTDLMFCGGAICVLTGLWGFDWRLAAVVGGLAICVAAVLKARK